MENQWIGDWLSYVAQSERTKSNYFRYITNFSKFCLERGKCFNTVVQEYRTSKYSGAREEQMFLDEWHDLIKAYTKDLKTKETKRGKYTPLSINYTLSVVKSFFKYHRIPLDVLRLRNPYVVHHNRDLRKEDILLILGSATFRDRVIFLIQAESGMRGDTLVQLKYWMIKEDYEANRVPMMIRTPPEILKCHVQNRFTFIGEDGFKALKQYLETRKTLHDDDYVFIPEKPGLVNTKKRGNFSANSLSVKFSRLARKLKLQKRNVGKPSRIRMHGLRKYFRNNMKADSAFVNFWMGHALGTDTAYLTDSPEIRHREEYKRGYQSLKILEQTATPAQLKDINDQLRQKDREIQELRDGIKFLKETIEKGYPFYM
jgi:site-specific recombinase XerD